MSAPLPEDIKQRYNDPRWHRRVWKLSWPIILANLTVPLVGIVDTAVMGHMPTANYIAAVALGAMLYSSVYWLFGFLRMGTTALVAQAHGADDAEQLRAALWRGALMAICIALTLLAVSPLLLAGAALLINAEPLVTPLTLEYLQIRLFGTPAYFVYLVVLGGLFGTQKMGATMLLTLLFNLLNVTLDLVFVLVFDWGVAGVAWGTVCSEWIAAAVGIRLIWQPLELAKLPTRDTFWSGARWTALLGMSRDLLIRTFFVQLPFLANTLLAARLGSVVLAGNAILMQFFFVVTYALDGFAHTAEALTGFAVGSRQRQALHTAAVYCGIWAAGLGTASAIILAVLGIPLIGFMTDITAVRASAREFLPWVIGLPLAGVAAFVYDGIYIGAGAARELRNAMLLAALVYLSIVGIATMVDELTNSMLWLGMLLFMLTRGILLALGYPKLMRRLFSPPPSHAPTPGSR